MSKHRQSSLMDFMPKGTKEVKILLLPVSIVTKISTSCKGPTVLPTVIECNQIAMKIGVRVPWQKEVFLPLGG